MHTVRYYHTFVLTGLWGLLLLAGLLVIFVLGLMELLAVLVSTACAFVGDEEPPAGPDEPSAEERSSQDAGGLFEALWAVPGKVRVGGVTIHVGWLVISLGIAALAALLR